MTSVLARRGDETQRQTHTEKRMKTSLQGEHRVRMEAGIGVMCLRAKERQDMPLTPDCKGKAWNGSPPDPSERV